MPGLILHTSNQLDLLADRLSEVVATPPVSPFTPEIVVVQSLASRRWLTLQIAQRQGICANYQFPFLSDFITQVVQKGSPVATPIEKMSTEFLTWKIDSLLPRCVARKEFAPVAQYLDDGDPLKRFHLAARLANLFDQYRVYRPEMVSDWTASKKKRNEDEAWQAALWRELGEAPGFNQALDRLRARGFESSLDLPERISIFAPASLPPAYLELLFQLARIRELHLFLLRPSREYRGDDPTAKQRARLGLEASDPAAGNPLATSWGKVDADLTDLLVDTEERLGIPVENGSEEFREFEPTTLLGAVKFDITHAQNRGVAGSDNSATAPRITVEQSDRSIVLHSCYSPMREVEVLYDQLLDCFETMPNLRPRDIIVMTPEIEKYAPLIRGVFGYPEDELMRIPYSLADRHPRSESLPIDTFLTLLDLPGSRYTAPQIFALLGSHSFRRRFKFNDEELSLIRDWIEETAIRWGVDAADRTRAGLPELDANTWRHGLDRLLLGYAMPGGNKQLFEGILPHDEVEGDGGAVLGRFVSATEALFRLTENFEHARPLADWTEPLLETVEQFLKPIGEEELREVGFLRTIIDQLRTVGDSAETGAKIDFRVVRQYLAEQLAAMEQRGQFFKGHVTFCALKPVRSIPARVVCLLGINDQVFPRRPQPAQFDLMARSARAGDPSARQDDRYSFLETLLSAGEKLLISYVGRSAIHNNEIPPSVVVSELFDYLDQAFVFPEKKTAREFVLMKHPLQAFSPRYFSATAADKDFFSYSEANAEASRSTSTRRAAEMPPFITDPLPQMEEANGSLELRELIDFWKNPSKYFVRKRLGLSLWEREDCLSDIEPFDLDHLERYRIKEELLANELETGELLPREVFQARGILPAGTIGDLHLRSMRLEVQKLIEVVRSHIAAGKKDEPVEVDLQLKTFRLGGKIHSLYGGQCVHFRTAKLNPKDHLRAWIEHLALCALTEGGKPETVLIGRDAVVTFGRVPSAHTLLQTLCERFSEGLTLPLRFFPESGMAFVETERSRKGDPFKKAKDKWEGMWRKNEKPRGEKDDVFIARCFDGPDALNEHFVELARLVFAPMLEHSEAGGAMTPFDITTAPLDAGVTLIEASAGTGKTWSITGLILRLILEKHFQIRDILAVTFTEAATQELRDRIRRRLQSALEDLRRGVSEDDIVKAFLKKGDKAVGIRELDLSIQSFDEAQIFTIHGFCQRMLNDYAFESGARFDTSLVTDPKPLFEEVARDFWRLRFYEAQPLLPKLAMAWKRSLEDWVELLERTRSHPDLAILPPAETEPGDALLRRVEAAFAAVREEWICHQADIEILLRHDGNLSRSEKNFREDQVDELLGKVAEACVDFEAADPESIKALSGITAEAIAAGTKATGTAPTHRFFTLSSDFCQAVEALFNQLTHEFLEFAQAELPKRKARTNTVTYDDLITGLRDALRQEGGGRLARAIGDKYAAALIDEFQDTDPAQYEIFRTIFGSKDHRLFLIGDPKQAIYGFRGADVFTYFQANTIADQTFTLTTNWRSEAPLLAAINGLFLQTAQPFIFPEIQYHQVHAPKKPLVRRLTNSDDAAAALRFRLVTPAQDQASSSRFDLVCQWVSDDVAALAASGAHLGESPLRYGDMAILVRKHSQAEMLQSVLRDRGIRSVVQSDRSVFASEEARDLQRFLQGVLDPRRDSLLKAALATTLIGFDANMLFNLERDDPVRQMWLDRFTDWKLRWSDGCFTAMFRELLVTLEVRARLVQLPAGERRLTNFLHLAELLHEAESTMSLAPDAVCSWLREQRESERVSEDRFQLRLESDDDAVQIVTIHKSKGLEYPIVFCPFLWTDAEFSGHKELLFHDREDREKRLTFDLRGKKAGAQQHQEWQSEEVRAEELRLLYVALTRAMNRCYIYLPGEKTEKSPLAYLFEPSKNESLFDQVHAFAQSSKGCASASSEPGEPNRAQDETPAATTLQPRPFKRKIPRVAMTASFSGLNVAAVELEEVDSGSSNDDELDTIIAPERSPADLSIFTFDRGRRTGDFFHGVLEHMDFHDLGDLSKLIEGKLRIHGFAQTLHRPAINQILQQLMEVELEPGIRLEQVSRSDRLSEVEFTYPLAHLTPASLAKIIDKCTGLAGDIRQRMGSLRFDPIEGFMRGFVDLLFRFKDRYYLVDWKSNWLGSQPADYGPEGMQRAMLEHNYFLQYHLYTLAADLFLERRLPGYDYQRHFGGVYYVFLRGIDPKNPARGIFRDRPEAKTVRNLRRLIS